MRFYAIPVYFTRLAIFTVYITEQRGVKNRMILDDRRPDFNINSLSSVMILYLKYNIDVTKTKIVIL